MTISVLVRGIGDVGSAVAWVLFKAGRSVVILDDPTPVTHRRMMGFADAMFDGETTLEGVTAREHLGSVVYEGATLPLAGGPCAIEGVGRERIVYAPASGLLSSARTIGDPVSAGEPVAMIDGTLIRAPITGTLAVRNSVCRCSSAFSVSVG